MSVLPAAVVIVGRTNVGKSTLFNRLVGYNRALVSTQAGTTRDTNLGIVNWRGHNFIIYDSGGIDLPVNEPAGLASLRRLNQIIKSTPLVLLVIDGQIGLLDSEINLAKKLRRLGKNVLVVVNKIDSPGIRSLAPPQILNFKTQLVSAKTGVGVGDLLDLMWPYLNKNALPEPQLKLAIIGQTNVGKSSLFNRLLNEERSLVLPTPHTTRDRQHHWLLYNHITVELVDTAGIRRQRRKAPTLEWRSAEQALQILPAVDVILLLVDASRPFSWQDQALADKAARTRRPVIIILHKADLVELPARANMEQPVKRYFPMLNFAAQLWVSAKSGEGVKQIIPLAQRLQRNWQRRLNESDLNKFSQRVKRLFYDKNLPLTSLSQNDIMPPTFYLYFASKRPLPRAVANLIETKLRTEFDFFGTPLKVILQTRRKK